MTKNEICQTCGTVSILVDNEYGTEIIDDLCESCSVQEIISCPIGELASEEDEDGEIVKHFFIKGSGHYAFIDVMGMAGHIHEVCQACSHPASYPVVVGGLELAYNQHPGFTVWVEGIEVNNCSLTIDQACEIANRYSSGGCQNVVVAEIN